MTTTEKTLKERCLDFLNEINEAIKNGTYQGLNIDGVCVKHNVNRNILSYAMKANLFTIVGFEGRRRVLKSNHQKILAEHGYLVMQVKNKCQAIYQKKYDKKLKRKKELASKRATLLPIDKAGTGKNNISTNSPIELELVKRYADCLNDIAKIHAFSVTHHIEYKAALDRNNVNSPYFTDAIVALGFFNPQTKTITKKGLFEPYHGRMVMSKISEICKENLSGTAIKDSENPVIVEVEKNHSEDLPVEIKIKPYKPKIVKENASKKPNERTISILWGLFKWTTKTR